MAADRRPGGGREGRLIHDRAPCDVPRIGRRHGGQELAPHRRELPVRSDQEIGRDPVTVREARDDVILPVVDRGQRRAEADPVRRQRVQQQAVETPPACEHLRQPALRDHAPVLVEHPAALHRHAEITRGGRAAAALQHRPETRMRDDPRSAARECARRPLEDRDGMPAPRKQASRGQSGDRTADDRYVQSLHAALEPVRHPRPRTEWLEPTSLPSRSACARRPLRQACSEADLLRPAVSSGLKPRAVRPIRGSGGRRRPSWLNAAPPSGSAWRAGLSPSAVSTALGASITGIRTGQLSRVLAITCASPFAPQTGSVHERAVQSRGGCEPPATGSTTSGRLGWGARIRTWEWRYQKPLPYHLATPHRGPGLSRRRGAGWQDGRAASGAVSGGPPACPPQRGSSVPSIRRGRLSGLASCSAAGSRASGRSW